MKIKIKRTNPENFLLLNNPKKFTPMQTKENNKKKISLQLDEASREFLENVSSGKRLGGHAGWYVQVRPGHAGWYTQSTK